MKTLLGLGEGETRYGQYSCQEAEPGVFGLLSVGSDPDAPSMRFKGSQDQPNEDSFLILSDEKFLLLAVADSHYGHEASHQLIERLSERCTRVPTGRGELALTLLGLTEPEWEGESESTLLVVVLDRQKRTGFGYNWGDSSAIAVGPSGIRRLVEGEETFLASEQPPEIENAYFTFELGTGELLALFTDGINECHYRNPDTSVCHDHVEHVFRAAEGDARRFATGLIEMALAGVDGNPGGQDNVALVVAAG